MEIAFCFSYFMTDCLHKKRNRFCQNFTHLKGSSGSNGNLI